MRASTLDACGEGPVAREAREAEEGTEDDDGGWGRLDRIAIVAEDETVRANAIEYFENYVYPLIGFTEKGFLVEGIATQEELFNAVSDADANPYCLGIYFKTFDLENHEFEIQYSFQKFQTPDSTRAPYNELVMVPDWEAWGQWTRSGVLVIETFVSEFIARSYHHKASPSATTFSEPSSLYDQ